MVTERINNSSTKARYKVLWGCWTEAAMPLEQIADFLEPYNFGCKVVAQSSDGIVLDIYID